MLSRRSSQARPCALAPRRAARQRGMFLIEAAVAILLFMLGILGMVGLSAHAVSAQSDAEYRTLAAQWASQIGQQAWVNVNRITGADRAARAISVRDTLLTFQHQKDGADCNFSGGSSANATVTAWVEALRDAPAGGLPGSSAAMQQILIDTTADGHNRMTITVCWQVPSNPVPRRHVFATLIN
jgi:type IV pilus assembly protein PilV